MHVPNESDNKHGRTKALLFAYYFVCSIGLLQLAFVVAGVISNAVIVPINSFISYSDWALLSSIPTKPLELLQYALSVMALVIYYVCVYVISKYFYKIHDNKLFKDIVSNQWKLAGCFSVLLIFNILLLRMHGQLVTAMLGIWLFVLILPVIPLINSLLDRSENKIKFGSIVLIIAIGISIIYSFMPFVTAKVKVSNDFMDIPEQTKLSSGYVDNTAYINDHRIGGLHKYDPRIDQGGEPSPRAGDYIKLKKTDSLVKFIENEPQKYAYSNKYDVLVVNGGLPRDDFEDLLKIAANGAERDRIYGYYSQKALESKTKKIYSSDEIEFARKNKRELLDQALAGHYFHHQDTMLGTINEYELGKSREKTVYLYGWLSTVVIATAMEVLGGITFENYQSAFYLFYPLYYLLLLVVASIIFKRLSYVLLVAVLAIGALYFLGFETIRFAPGFNPVRHFLDIFSLLCFYWYLFANHRKQLYLAMSLSFAIIGLLFSKEFGLVLFLALLVAVVSKSIAERNKKSTEIILSIIAIIVALGLLLTIKTAKNQTLIYVLLGVAAPPMSQIIMIGMLVIFSGVYVLVLSKMYIPNNWRYLVLFWFLYTQGLLIYYIWNPAPNHLMSLGAIWGMLVALLIKLWVSNYECVARYENKLVAPLAYILMLIMYLPAMLSYQLDRLDYESIFKNHKIYRWDLPAAKFQSTMDPSVFANSVALINKYSKSNAIYILSKYDNILPFLSRKYSAMPFPELDLSLVTNKEMAECIDLLHKKQPEYLFVDTDMLRSHLGDIYARDDPFSQYAAPVYEASRGRAMVLDNFAKLFDKIKGSYEPVEEGYLITVYKRRG